MSLAPDDPRHGTNNGYGNLGCRCGACRDAHREYQRATLSGGYRRVPCPGCGGLKRPQSARCQACDNAAREAPHGTETRYISRGCRCDLCRAASADARRQRRARSAA